MVHHMTISHQPMFYTHANTYMVKLLQVTHACTWCICQSRWVHATETHKICGRHMWLCKTQCTNTVQYMLNKIRMYTCSLCKIWCTWQQTNIPCVYAYTLYACLCHQSFIHMLPTYVMNVFRNILSCIELYSS